MEIDQGIRDLEELQSIPITSFPWWNPENEGEWAPEMADLGDYLRDRANGRSSVIFMPGSGGDSFSSSHNAGEKWKIAKLALDFVHATSAPCAGHILRGRILDVLEARLPGQDAVHEQVMDCFNEAQHTVWMKEVAGDH